MWDSSLAAITSQQWLSQSQLVVLTFLALLWVVAPLTGLGQDVGITRVVVLEELATTSSVLRKSQPPTTLAVWGLCALEASKHKCCVTNYQRVKMSSVCTVVEITKYPNLEPPGNPYPPLPSKGTKNGKNNGWIANSPFEDPKVKLLEEQNAILQNALKQHNIQLPTTQKNTSEEDAKSAQEEIQRLLQKGIPENEIPPSLVKIAKSQTQAQNENKNEQTVDELQLERKLNNARKQLQKKTVDYNRKVEWLAEARLHGMQAQAEVDELEKQY